MGCDRTFPTGQGGSTLISVFTRIVAGKNYPLVVKLGTITKDGADVYSYASDEDKAVLDPYLATHLVGFPEMLPVFLSDTTMPEIQTPTLVSLNLQANIGINIMQCEKTEKTVAEQEFV